MTHEPVRAETRGHDDEDGIVLLLVLVLAGGAYGGRGRGWY